MNSFLVYILKFIFVGRTHDIDKRLAEHTNKQDGIYTARRLPVLLVFQQEFVLENDVYAMEQKLKGWSRKKKKH